MAKMSKIFLSLLFFVACQKPTSPSDLRDSNSFVPALIESRAQIERATHDGSFEVTYEFDRDVNVVLFALSDDFRVNHWKIIPFAGDVPLQIRTEGTQDRILAADGDMVKTFRRFKIEVPIDRSAMTQSDPILMQFSDKSIALNSYGFAIIPLALRRGASQWDMDRRLQTQFSFRAAPGERILIKGKPWPESTPWHEEELDNLKKTYWYFGGLPVETVNGISMLIDPALDSSMKEIVRNYTPRFLNLYAEKMGVLKEAPAVYLNVKVDDPDCTRGAGGSARSGLFLVRVCGVDAAGPLSDLTAQGRVMLNVIAHETVHFWNAVYAIDRDHNDWTWEGGAVALVRKTLIETSLFNAQDVLEYDARWGAPHCEQILGHKTFNQYRASPDSAKDAEYLPYACGSWVWNLAETLLTRNNSRHTDLYSLWKRVNSKAQSRDGHYDQNIIFESIGELLGEDSGNVIPKLKEFFDTPGDQLRVWEQQVLRKN